MTNSLPSQSSAPGIRTELPRGWEIWLGGTLAAFVVILLLIRPLGYTDTFNYAKHIVDQSRGNIPANANPFFDFGHLIWRPLGLLLWSPLRNLLRPLFHSDDILSAGAVLIAMSIAGGLCGAVSLFLMIARSTSSVSVAGATTVGYLCCNALITHTPTGMAYVTGVACQIAALCILQRALSREKFTFSSGAVSGLLLGLSIVIWFPYILAGGGVLCYALLAEESENPLSIRRRVYGMAGLLAGAALVVALVYGYVLVLTGFTSLDGINEWMSRSRYGKKPDRGFLRMLAGVPRGFLFLGEGSVAWKRMLFEQGHSISFAALMRSGIWKVASLYFVLAASVLALWKSGWGRRLLVCLIAVAVPLVIFAAVLFEATPPERFLASFPLLFLAWGRMLADRNSGRFLKASLGVFFCMMVGVNLTAMSRFRSDREFDAARGRLHALNQNVQPRDKIVLISYADDMHALASMEPFNPESKIFFLLDAAFPWGDGRREVWIRKFAESTQSVWDAGGNVWLSRRFLAAKPERSWKWVDDDIPGLQWRQLPEFFSQLDLVNSIGDGADGFAQVAQTNKNKELLSGLTRAATPEERH